MIKELFLRVRFQFAFLLKGAGFYNILTSRLYGIYLNHQRVIHWREGCPVYSLSTPPLYSAPMANLIARSFYGVLQNRKLPNMMSFAITDKCDLSCPQCSFSNVIEENSKRELSFEECQHVIRAAQELGVALINLTGGEPLASPFLEDLIKSIDKNLSSVMLFTSGKQLAMKAKALKKAGLDGVYISIDSPSAQRHDELRGHRGLFDEAISGALEAKKVGMSVGFSYCAFPNSLENGDLEGIIELGKKHKIHEIVVFCAVPCGKLRNNRELDKTDWIEDVIKFSEKYRDKQDYPGLNIYNYNSSWRSLGCSGGSRWFYVSPYGDVNPCDFNHYVAGNIRDTPLHLIWEELSNLPPFVQTTYSGCKIRNSLYRDGVWKAYINP